MGYSAVVANIIGFSSESGYRIEVRGMRSKQGGSQNRRGKITGCADTAGSMKARPANVAPNNKWLPVSMCFLLLLSIKPHRKQSEAMMDFARAALHSLNGKSRTFKFDRAMKVLTHMGGASFSIVVLLVVIVQFQFPWDGLFALITSHLLVQVMKKAFRRRRPYIVESSLHFNSKPLKDCSFPSGHTTAVFATNVSLALAFPWLAPLLLAVACLVGWSQIYLGFHYPADVIVGALIGGTTALIFYMI